MEKCPFVRVIVKIYSGSHLPSEDAENFVPEAAGRSALEIGGETDAVVADNKGTFTAFTA